MALTNSSGSVVERYRYDAYGAVTIMNAAGTEITASAYANAYLFTGRRLDAETGLYYFRARMYDAELGRFLSRDPLGYVDGMSLYRGYMVPNGMDPLGTFVNDWWEEVIQTYGGNQANLQCGCPDEEFWQLFAPQQDADGCEDFSWLADCDLLLGEEYYEQRGKASSNCFKDRSRDPDYYWVPGGRGGYYEKKHWCVRYFLVPLSKPDASDFILPIGGIGKAGGKAAGEACEKLLKEVGPRAAGKNASDCVQKSLLTGSQLRDKLTELFLKKGIDLREYEFFVHGCSSKILDGVNGVFKHNGKTDLFTTVDMDIAKIFGLRGVAKAGCGELDGVLILIKKDVFKRLRGEGSVVVKQIDDIPGQSEIIFKPSSATTLNDCAEFIRLGPGFFTK